MNARRQAGFTLVELLIVATLTSLLAVLLLQLFRPVSANTARLRARATAVSELRAATERLLQDFGGVTHAEADAGTLLLVREQAVAEFQGAWRGGADAGIRYSFSDGELRRDDLALGDTELVARGLSGFPLEAVSSRELHVSLEAQVGDETPSIRLIWDESGARP